MSDTKQNTVKITFTELKQVIQTCDPRFRWGLVTPLRLKQREEDLSKTEELQ
jgi:hypothetical protein